MDPLSQGTVGAAFAQSAANKNNILKIGVIGFLAGLAPDLDILIQSSTDPILFLEYHRQFTHSLFFIPFGSLIVALVLFPLVKSSMSIKTVYFASLLGYATHGLLDACTSYGTQLFWPFSNERVTWNNISIVDPLFTIPVLILIGIAIKTKKKIFSFFVIGFGIYYLMRVNQSNTNMSLLFPRAQDLVVEGIKFRDLNKNGKLDIYEDNRQNIDDRVDDLISQMTIEEKAGSMFINWYDE